MVVLLRDVYFLGLLMRCPHPWMLLLLLQVVSCSQFEAHAGRGARRAPYDFIFTGGCIAGAERQATAACLQHRKWLAAFGCVLHVAWL